MANLSKNIAVFEVNGVDFTRFIAEGGLKWERNDIDSTKTGRTMDTIMHRTRLAIKRKLYITCMPMRHDDLIALNKAILPQFIKVRFLDPIDGLTTKTFYGSSVQSTTQYTQNGETWWDGPTFNLIER